MTDPAMWELVREGGSDIGAGHQRKRKAKAFVDEENEAEEHGEQEERDPEEDMMALEALWDRRAELDLEGEGEPEPFIYTLRGGVWAHHHVGVAFDSYRSLASGAKA